VKDATAARDGVGPAGVGAQVGGHDGETVASVDTGALECRSHRRLASDVADGRSYLAATAQQLGDAPSAEEARPAGDQD
jgi:hypothetical protein